MDPELKKLLEQKRKTTASLKKDIADNLSASERIFFLLKEGLKEQREDATAQDSGSATDDVLDVENILDSIVNSSEGASLGDIKNQKVRLQALKNTLKGLQDALSDSSRKRIEGQISQTEDALKKSIGMKSKLSEKASGFFKNYGIDITSVAAAGAGGDPLGAFFAKIVGGSAEKFFEKRKERKQQILSDKKSLYENVRDRDVGIKTPTPQFEEPIQQSNQTSAIGGGNAESKLDQIQENTFEMRKDLKILVQDETERLQKEEKNAFDVTENAEESARKKGATLVKEKISEEAKKGGWISKLTEGLTGDIIGGIIGGEVAGVAGTLVGRIAAVATPIVVPAVLLAIAGYAWYKALEALPQALAKLPKDPYEEKLKKGPLTPSEEIVYKGEQLRAAKEQQQKLEDSTKGFFGANPNSPIYQGLHKTNESTIKQRDQELVQAIQKQYPNASPEQLAALYSKASGQENVTNVPGMQFSHATEQDLYQKKIEKVHQKAKQMGWSPEKTQQVIEGLSRPGTPGFTVSDKMLVENNLERPAAPENRSMVVDKSLGSLSAEFESGSTNTSSKAGLISSGVNDPGGKSYGPHQLSSKAGTLGAYVRQSKYADEFMGLTPGSSEFDAKWKEIATREPEDFANDQNQFITKTHFDPAIKEAEKLGFKTENRGVQEAVYSGSVQHKGIKSILENAAQQPGFENMTPEQQLKVFYEARSQYTDNLAAVPYTAGRGRYEKELPKAIELAKLDVTPKSADTYDNLATLSNKNMQLEASKQSGGGTTNVINNTNLASSDNKPGPQRGINGPVGTRNQEPTLLAIQEKSMKGAVT